MAQVVALLFLTFFFLELLVELALNEMNIAYVRDNWSAKVIPNMFRNRMAPEDYEKSTAYTLAKGRFQRWAELYGGIITLFVLFGGVLPFLDHFSQVLGSPFPSNTQAAGILFCFGLSIIVSVLGLPTDFYSTFVLEERFGFNKTNFKLYLSDKLKGLLLGIVIGIPFLFGVLWLMQVSGRYWWAWAFFFISAFQVLMIVVYPTLIAPFFNKFEPMAKGELRERISALAHQVGLKTSGIYTMDGSKRSAHSNAYFTGIGKAKRTQTHQVNSR